MAINAFMTTPNFAQGRYHRIQRVELVFNAENDVPHYIITMALYHNETVYARGCGPVYTDQWRIELSELPIDTRDEIYFQVMQRMAQAGLNPVSDE